MCHGGRPLRAILLAGVAVAALLPAALPAFAGMTVAPGDILADTVWEGEVEVTGAVRVETGTTLLVQPGTTVRFAAGRDAEGRHRARLLVAGTLVAQGRADAPILFTSAAAEPQPGDWGGIVLERANRRPSRLAHAAIRFAENGVTGSYSTLLASDATLRDNVIGILALQDMRGQLFRSTVAANGTGVSYKQNSAFAIEGCEITGNAGAGIACTLGSSPAIRLSLIADNGPRGILLAQGSSPLVEGNTIRGHQDGINMELQTRPVVSRNLITGNDVGLWIEKLAAPEVRANSIRENRVGVYCNYSAYPVLQGNNLDGNAELALVLGDNMSILMEKQIPFRHLGQAYFGATPPEASRLPVATRKFQPFAGSDEGIVDARGNWWGDAPTAEMRRLGGEEGNVSVIHDFFDDPDTWYEGKSYRRDRVVYAPWEERAVEDTAPPPVRYPSVSGKVVSSGKPVEGVRVHLFADAAGGFHGEGASYSAPTDANGAFSVAVDEGTWYLVAKGPDPPFPHLDPGEGALFGYYGGNPVTATADAPASVNLQVVRRRGVEAATGAPAGSAILEGEVLGPGGPVEGASVHLYPDAGRQFRGPDLFGPLGSVPSGTDSRGRFSAQVPPGTYFAVASRRRGGGALGPLRTGDLHGYFDGNPVELADGERLAVTIQVVEKLRDAAGQAASGGGATGIRGHVRDPAGKVPAGVYAYATTDPSFMIGAMPPHRSAVVGRDGVFSIDLPAGGTYFVSARSGYGGPPLPGEWHGFHGDKTPSPVSVETGSWVEGIEIVVRKME